VGFEKKLEIIGEMTVLAMAMFLAAFFCFRVLLLPKATRTTIEIKTDNIYEFKKKPPAEG
jgi:hypothetical protein